LIPSILRREDLDEWARWAVAAAFFLAAFYVFTHTYAWIAEMIRELGPGKALFWDARVFAAAGDYVAAGRNPYTEHVIEQPISLPFITAPLAAVTLGGFSSVFGPLLFPLLAVAHLAAMVLAPLMLARYFFGRSLSEAALAYGLFFFGINSFGVVGFTTGNFGSVLYLAIFAGMFRGLRDGKWLWFHIAIAVAMQVKPPFALLWAVPVMVNGWDWRLLRQSAIAAAAGAAIYPISYLINPDYFRDWLASLNHQVNFYKDFGFSTYSAVRGGVRGTPAEAWAPYLVHIIVCCAMFAFLLRDRTRGPLRVAALVAFAIFANPRMKEYDAAFASIAVGALLYQAFAAVAMKVLKQWGGGAALARALALGALAVFFVVIIQANEVELIRRFTSSIAIALGIVGLAFIPRAEAESAAPAAAPATAG